MDPLEPSTPPQAPAQDAIPASAAVVPPTVVPPSLPDATRRRFSWRDFILGMIAGAIGGILVLFLLVFGLAYYVVRSESGTGFVASESVGSIPEFPAAQPLSIYGRADDTWTFTTLDGQSATLADFRGKVVFLNFWATWCGPCVAEMPSIERLRDALKDDPVEFVLVSEEEKDTIDRFIKRKQWRLTSYRTDVDTPPVFESFGIPTTYILNPDGLVVFKHVGMAQWDHESTVSFVRRLLTK
jgi:thiol-disulfide isomerase/thioredoxin